MLNKPVSIGIFFMSDSIKSFIKELNEFEGVTITIVDKSFEEAIEAGRKLEKKGVEVLIGRRGTADMLRQNINIPVLAFPNSTMGLFSSLKEASLLGKKILLPVYKEPMENFDLVQEFFNIEIKQSIYEDAASLFKAVETASNQGYEVAIGGKATKKAALVNNILYCEFITLESEIIETINNAKSVAMSARAERAMLKEYQTIIDVASDAIIATDKSGKISSINKIAITLLDLKDENHKGKSIGRVIKNKTILKILSRNLPVADKVVRFNDSLYLLSLTPIRMGETKLGSVISIKEVNQIVKAENKVRRSLSKGFTANYTIDEIKHQSSQMVEIINQTKEFAKTGSSVLIIGETGTGKELFAQSIHNLSNRKEKPFVSINCGALPEGLLESELFGYEEGAFTGSKKGGKPGLFEIAHCGTIFLDEIDSTTIMVQKRLLKVLQEKEVMRIGAAQKVPIDVRIIAASGRELWPLVGQKKFRKDLFFRLNILQITVPTLKERKDDIKLLLDHFLEYYQKKHTISEVPITCRQLDDIINYEWPGNIRQLKYFTERLVLHQLFNKKKEGTNKLIADLYKIIENKKELPEIDTGKDTGRQTTKGLRLPPSRIENSQWESNQIATALQEARFNRRKAADSLGISRATLWRKIKKHNLET